MLSFGLRNIFLYTQLTDMRKSYDTLSAIVRQFMRRDPYCGDAYVFIGKRKNRMKVLIFEDSGFWLCAKRLEQGTFSIPFSKENDTVSMTESQWQLLLEGIIIIRSRRLKRYKKKLN